MAESKGPKTMYNVEAKDCENVIVGEGNTLNIYHQQKEVDKIETALEILATLTTLPGKPFHKCFKRSTDVEKMSSIFEGMEDQQNEYLTTLYLTGPPGSGKTQLARQFGEQFLGNTPNGDASRPVVLSINVNSIKSLLKSMKELLHELKLVKAAGITTEGDEIKEVQMYMEELRTLLRKYPGKWLLIFDDLFSEDIRSVLLPQAGCENWGNGRIIVTSQNSDLAPACQEHAKKLPLNGGLDEKDALNLLEEVSGVKADTFAVTLAKELEYFPLSLACSATYVGQMLADRPSSNFSWKQFLKLHQECKGMLKFSTYEKSNVYPQSMVVVTRLATSRLAEYSSVLRHAFDFLSYCTISPVPLDIVSNFVQASISSDTRSDEIKAEISRCSLLVNASTAFETVENIKCHQVVGKAFEHVREARATSEEKDAEQRRMEYVSLLHSLQESLDKAIPDYDRSSVAMKKLVSPHLKAIVDYGKAQKWTESAEFVVILAFLADCLYHVPGVTEAERIAYSELAYEIAQRLPEPMKSIGYCQVLKTLGFYYREATLLEKSVVLLEEGLRLADNEDSTEWMALKSTLLNILSWSYKLQMKVDLAEETMKESIRIAKIAFGDQHQEVVERLCNFAIIYREKQDLAKAKEIADEARQMAESSTDKWNLTRAQAANYSAKIYLRYAESTDNPAQKEELLADSLSLHAEALTTYENVLGSNHIYVAGVSKTYAIVHKERNEHASALALVERAEQIYRDVEHVQLSSALCYKTEVLLALGKASEAEKAIEESIGLSNCGRARFLRAQVYLQQERYHESRVIIKEVLARWKSGILPPTHIWVKNAEKIKKQCGRGILKMYIRKLVPVLVVFISILLAIWYRSE